MHLPNTPGTLQDSDIIFNVILTDSTTPQILWEYAVQDSEGGRLVVEMLAGDLLGNTFTNVFAWRYSRVGSTFTLAKEANPQPSNDQAVNQLTFDVIKDGFSLKLRVTGMAKPIIWKALITQNKLVFNATDL